MTQLANLEGITDYWPVAKWMLIWLVGATFKKMAQGELAIYGNITGGIEFDPYNNKAWLRYGSYVFLMGQIICLYFLYNSLSDLGYSIKTIGIIFAVMHSIDFFVL